MRNMSVCNCSSRNIVNWAVIAGRHHEKKDDAHQQVRNITKILIHENYVSDTIDEDLALMKVEPPFVFDDYVSAACLPSSLVVDNTSCMSSGWGDTKGKFYTNY